jgi:hypothetical protein
MGPPSLLSNRQHGEREAFPLWDWGERSVSRALTTPAIPATTSPPWPLDSRRPSAPLDAMATLKLLTQQFVETAHRL